MVTEGLEQFRRVNFSPTEEGKRSALETHTGRMALVEVEGQSQSLYGIIFRPDQRQMWDYGVRNVPKGGPEQQKTFQARNLKRMFIDQSYDP